MVTLSEIQPGTVLGLNGLSGKAWSIGPVDVGDAGDPQGTQLPLGAGGLGRAGALTSCYPGQRGRGRRGPSRQADRECAGHHDGSKRPHEPFAMDPHAGSPFTGTGVSHRPLRRSRTLYFHTGVRRKSDGYRRYFSTASSRRRFGASLETGLRCVALTVERWREERAGWW